MNSKPQRDYPKFWSDEFDMDLLKVFPEAPALLRDPERLLWTVGHLTHARLNHPSVWNGHGAFLWLQDPELERDQHGWFRICDGCIDNSPEVECTWLEWLRGAWAHRYQTVVLPWSVLIPAAPLWAFETLLNDIRGWGPSAQQSDVELATKQVQIWVGACDGILNSL